MLTTETARTASANKSHLNKSGQEEKTALATNRGVVNKAWCPAESTHLGTKTYRHWQLRRHRHHCGTCLHRQQLLLSAQCPP